MIVALVLASCGGKQATPAPAQPVQPAHAPQAQGESEQEMEQVEAKMTPEMRAFHRAFAPHWHAPLGAQRATATCGALGELHAAAKALAGAPAPTQADAAAWTTATHQLLESILQLGQVCAQPRAPGFDATFARVHESFHAVMAADGFPMPPMDGAQGGPMEHGQ